jgi:hypothetical protein
MRAEGTGGVGGVGGGGVDGREDREGYEGHEGFEDEVAVYAAGVRAQLVDLPADASAELLEDLEDHLREVAAEGAGTLGERLGEPAVYARELRQAAGLPAPGEVPRTGASARWGWRMLGVRARIAVRTAERRIRATDAGRAVLEFLPSLRPAWWVFRAWVLVRVLEVWTGNVDLWHEYSLIPRIGESRLVGLVALLAAVPASVYLGRRGLPQGWRRRTVLVAEGALAVFAFGIMVTGLANEGQHSDASRYQVGDAQQHFAGGPYVASGSVQTDFFNKDGHPIVNLWVYDKDGKRLDGVYVYDQDGQPVSLGPAAGGSFSGSGEEVDGGAWVDGDGQLVTNRYPRQLLRAQWNEADNTKHYTALPPPAVTLPRAVHQPTDPQATPQGPATSSGPASDGPSATPNPSAGSLSPSAGATPATATPGGATPAHGSSTPSAPPPTPATPGATG